MIDINSMDSDGYRHDYKGFCPNFTYQMSINRQRITITQGGHASLVGNSFLFSLSLSVKGIDEKIKPSKDRVDTCRGWTLKKIPKLL